MAGQLRENSPRGLVSFSSAASAAGGKRKRRVDRSGAWWPANRTPGGTSPSEREAGCDAAGALVHVDQAALWVKHAIEPAHQPPHRENGIGGPQAAVRGAVAAAVPLVAAIPRHHRAVQVETVETIAVPGLRDLVCQPVGPETVVADREVALFRMAMVRSLHQSHVRLPGPVHNSLHPQLSNRQPRQEGRTPWQPYGYRSIRLGMEVGCRLVDLQPSSH